jgi:ribosome-associated toxin RatA of RatAB toxin-antitoxin module
MVLMPVFERSALVAYSAEQMFELVDGVAAYPEFLPWCVDSEELARDSERVDAPSKIASQREMLASPTIKFQSNC